MARLCTKTRIAPPGIVVLRNSSARSCAAEGLLVQAPMALIMAGCPFLRLRSALRGADAPDHLQPRPATLSRVEHQLVDEVADDGEAEPSLPVGDARQVRDVEPATGIYDGYLDGPRPHPVLDLVALDRRVPDDVGRGLRDGELEIVDVLGSEAGDPSDLGHHEAGEQNVPRATRKRERDGNRDPDPFSLVYLRGFALHQSSRPPEDTAEAPRQGSP